MGEQVLNALYKHTALRTAIYYNMLALVEGQPRVLGLKAILGAYIEFRKEIVIKRTQFDLRKARDRAHILEGLEIALDNLDAVIALIRGAESAEAARLGLMTTFGLSQRQAQAILDMQLRRLAALERQRILDEYAEVQQLIADLEALLADSKKIEGVVREEVVELRDKYGDERRTEINDQEARDFTKAELVPHQEVAVTLSQRGYIKRVPASTYRIQRRGGRGIRGMITREADAVKHLLVCDTHDTLFFFTNRGRVAPLKCYELPADASRTARGLPLVNYISTLTMEDKITAVIAAHSLDGEANLVFATKLGEVKRTPIKHFANVRSTGIIAMDLEEGDEVVAARIAMEEDDIVLVTEKGQALRFNVSKLRAASRTSGGVRGMSLKPGDQVVAMEVAAHGQHLLTLTKNGFGKRTPMASYPAKGRNGQGMKTFNITAKTGNVCAAVAVSPGQELMMVSRQGVVNRTTVDEISRQGRITQGVTIMNVEDGDELVSVSRIDPAENGNGEAEDKGE
jgi:DNA gyrase subunit A